MLWAGSFQYRIITSGGRTASPTRNAHADGEVMSRKRPAPHTARIQNKAIEAFKYLGCIVEVYGLSPDCDVPECTPALQLQREAARAITPSQHRAGSSLGPPSSSMRTRSAASAAFWTTPLHRLMKRSCASAGGHDDSGGPGAAGRRPVTVRPIGERDAAILLSLASCAPPRQSQAARSRTASPAALWSAPPRRRRRPTVG